MPILNKNSIQSLAYQHYLNGPEWESIRLQSIQYHTRKGKLNCYTCGRTLFDIIDGTSSPKVNIHHLRYPDSKAKQGDFIVARDTMPVCRKCHNIIASHPQMQDDPTMTKRK